MRLVLSLTCGFLLNYWTEFHEAISERLNSDRLIMNWSLLDLPHWICSELLEFEPDLVFTCQDTTTTKNATVSSGNVFLTVLFATISEIFPSPFQRQYFTFQIDQIPLLDHIIFICLNYLNKKVCSFIKLSN